MTEKNGVISKTKVIAAMAAVVAFLTNFVPANAAHIPTSLDMAGLRTPLPNEGYLAYLPNPLTGNFGEEYTGWIDVRHPAMNETADVNFGFDRSDHFVNVRTTTLTDAGMPPVTATPNIPRDFDFANKAYLLQGGLSVIETAHRNYTSGDMPPNPPSTFTFPLTFAQERDIKSKLNGGSPTVDTYYAASLDSGFFAETYFPSMEANPALFVANTARNDTFAHELGHFVVDGRAIHTENANPDQSHSGDNTNLMAGGGIRLIPNSIADIGPVRSATVGGRDQLTTTPDNPGGAFPGGQSQVERIFAAAGGANGNGAAPFVQTTNDPHAAGNRVDWDFVTDHNSLESIPNRADNHQGVDSLFWGIGTTVAPTHPAPGADNSGHDHTGLGMFPAIPDFTGPFISLVDVFSLSTRYSDSDVNPATGNLSLREGALDYDLFFLGRDRSVVPGIPILDFMGGWSPTTFVDDFLVRWQSPIDAIGLFILADSGIGHDGTVQIDAVIAGIVPQIPEPSTLALVVPAMLAYFLSRRRRNGA